jgi:hypothetical protein
MTTDSRSMDLRIPYDPPGDVFRGRARRSPGGTPATDLVRTLQGQSPAQIRSLSNVSSVSSGSLPKSRVQQKPGCETLVARTRVLDTVAAVSRRKNLRQMELTAGTDS